LLRYKFDDERVTKEDPRRVLEEQYGGEEEVNILFLMVVAFDPYEHLLMIQPLILYFNSYRRQILDSITLLLNLPNTQMLICWCIYVKLTRKK
jgi:hypothetical protein